MNIQSLTTTPTGLRAFVDGRQPETSIFEATSPPATPSLSARSAFLAAQTFSPRLAQSGLPRPQARPPHDGRIDQLRVSLDRITRLLDQSADPRAFLPLLTDENILAGAENLIGAIEAKLRSAETTNGNAVHSQFPNGQPPPDGGDDSALLGKRLIENGALFARNLFADVSAHLALLGLLAEQPGATEPRLTRVPAQAAAALSAAEPPLAAEAEAEPANPPQGRKRRAMQKQERIVKKARLDESGGEKGLAGAAESAAAAVPDATPPVAAKKARKKLLERAKKSLRNMRTEGTKRSTSQDLAAVINALARTADPASGISAEAASPRAKRGLKRKATPAANSGRTPLNTPRAAPPKEEMQATPTAPDRTGTPYLSGDSKPPRPARVAPAVPPLRLPPDNASDSAVNKTVAENTEADAGVTPVAIESPRTWKLPPQSPPRSHRELLTPREEGKQGTDIFQPQKNS